jgi:cytochrome c oxidase cbb3-type subunit I/II
MEKEKFSYDNKIVRMFIIATMIYGLIGMLVGLIVALQFVFPKITLDVEFLSFGRIRPLHTNAVIFAFVGNAIFCGNILFLTPTSKDIHV